MGGHLIKENMVMYPRNDFGFFFIDDFLDSIIQRKNEYVEMERETLFTSKLFLLPNHAQP